jgi:NAD(P)H dehydrogenase (quinone)
MLFAKLHFRVNVQKVPYLNELSVLYIEERHRWSTNLTAVQVDTELFDTACVRILFTKIAYQKDDQENGEYIVAEDCPEQYLVTGVTGFQGGAVARLLATRGYRVRGLSRGGNASASTIPSVTMAVGDLASPKDVHRAFEGITRAFVTFPLVFDAETILTYAHNVAEAARRAEVRQLVYNTGTVIPEELTSHAAFETRRNAEAVLQKSGVPLVVIRPTIYLDNLFSPWNGPAIVNQGVVAYPVQDDRRVAWLPHADLAAAVAVALHRDDLVGEVIDVGGREVVTGAELAASFACALGRDIRYVALDITDFEAGLAQALGSESAAAVAGHYRWISSEVGRNLLDVNPDDVQRRLEIELTPLSRWISNQPWDQWQESNAR